MEERESASVTLSPSVDKEELEVVASKFIVVLPLHHSDLFLEFLDSM